MLKWPHSQQQQPGCQPQRNTMIPRITPCQGPFGTAQWRCWLTACCLAWPLTAGAEVFTALVIAVPDGDTLWVQPANSKATRKLRLQGIDAPEICQSGGAASRAALQRLVAGATVRVELKYYDSYGRGLARLRLRQQDVGAMMVRSGHAWSYRWHKSPGPYAAEEAAARHARAGLFSAKTPELPRDFRKRHGSCYPR